MSDIGKIFAGLGTLISGISSLKSGLDGIFGDGEPSSGKLEKGKVVSQGSGAKATYHTVKSIDERLKHIHDMIKRSYRTPRLRAMAVEVVSQKCGEKWCTPEKNNPEEVKAVFAFVRKHVRYVRDPIGIDTFQHALRTLHKDVSSIGFGGGDCDDYTIVLGSMLGAIGFPVKSRIIQTTDADSWNHIYLLVGLPPRNPPKQAGAPGTARLSSGQGWIPLDASVTKPAGWEAPRKMITKWRDFPILLE